MRILGFFLIFLFAAAANAQSQLNGISLYRYLNKEFFIAALYTEQPGQSAEQLLASELPMKMVIRVSVKRWKANSFKQMWIRDLSLNNELDQQPELAKMVVKFTDLVKGNLTTGDEILVTYAPDTGSTVLLNQQEVERVPGKAYFNALLRAWVGNAPPSRQFQAEILGEKSAETDAVLDRFSKMEVQSDRKALLSEWRKDNAAEAAARVQAEREAQEQARMAEEQAREAEERRLAELKRIEEEKRLIEERRIAEEKRLAEQKRFEEERKIAEQKRKEEEAKLAAEQEKADAKRKAELQKLAEERRIAEEKRLAEEKRKAEELRLAAAKAEEQARKDLEKQKQLEEQRKQLEDKERMLALESQRAKEEADKALAALQLKTQVAEAPSEVDIPNKILSTSPQASAAQKKEWEEYKKQIVAEVEAEVEYPQWSKKNRHQGDVEAAVTLNANGSLKEVKLLKTTRYTLLNEAIETAIEKIGEFEDFPEWVKDETVTVNVQYSFKPGR